MTDLDTIDATMEAYHDTMIALAHEKRLVEKWTSDPSFRARFADDPSRTLDQQGISLSVVDVQSIARGEPSETFNRIQEMAYSKMQWTSTFYHHHCTPSSKEWVSWRTRQINRQVLDLGPHHAITNIHSSLAIELNKGCSVGCWFCALSPDKQSTPLLYHDGGRELFSALVRACINELGDAVKSGFLYWATEPMDNPDYEQYCLDFHALTSIFPPTTTSVAHRHPERIRRLLTLAAEHHSWLTRFSVLTTSIMDRIHAMYTAEELALAECLPLNREASFAYGVAGRYRDYLKAHPDAAEEQRKRLERAPWYNAVKDYINDDVHAHASIACVTGFLINTVDRSIELISPTAANDVYPLGYIVFARESFTSHASIPDALQRVVARGRKAALTETDRCALAPYLKVSGSDMVVSIEGRLGGKAHVDTAACGIDAQTVIASLQMDSYSLADVIRSLVAKGADESAARVLLTRFWNLGTLCEPVSS